MRSSSDYQTRFAVQSSPPAGAAMATVDRFLFSQCSPCPAGKGPLASCKHIAGVLYGLEEFCRLGFTREAVTCTDKLQQWNRPHSKKIAPMKAVVMDWRKPSLGKQATSQTQSLRPKYTAASLSDPMPASMRGGAQS